MGKKDVHKLSSESDKTFVLLGISSHENDYRLSWGINESLGFKLVKSDNHVSYNLKLKENQEFSTYNYLDEESASYRLISNRCNNGFLLDELKNIDFLLLIEPFSSTLDIKEVMNKIRTVPFISAVFSIDQHSLKNKKRLL